MNRHIRTATPLLATLALLALVLASGCGMRPRAGTDPRLDTASVDEPAEDYDPWQAFNEPMFAFNHQVLDRYLMKPAAKGWEKVVPAVARRSIARLFDNLEMPQRFLNNLLQARPLGAGRELARFAVNTTVGVVGLVDVASMIDIEPSPADAGQTLAMYGFGPGPYLVLPTMAPSCVRDAIGTGIDGTLDPIGYFLPFVANRVKAVVNAVNQRSLNLKLYADVEESVLDLYAAARNGYLQRRRVLVARAVEDRDGEWRWAFGPTPERPLAVAVADPEDPA